MRSGTNVVHLLFSSKSNIFPPYKLKAVEAEMIFFGGKTLYFHVPGNLCWKDTDVIPPCVVGWGLE